ncbi:MAG TPA: methyl-accepting chemotaxis protein [Symbiobacteriaceae bacterium]|nr:methyl-accepting chemotaxis protein [Symbiobacteriaceae bacterium]
MSYLRNSIRSKLLIGFSVIIALTLVVGASGWYINNGLMSSFRSLSTENLAAATQLSTAERALWELRFGIANFMTGNAEARAKILADSDKWFQQLNSNLSAFKQGSRSAEELAMLSDLEKNLAEYAVARPKWFDLYAAGKTEEAAKFRAEYTNKYASATVQGMSKLIDLQHQLSEEKLQAAVRMGNLATVVMGAIGTLTLVIGVVAALMLAQRLSRPIVAVAAAAERLARGDLTGRELQVTGKDEAAALTRAFNQMTANLRGLIGQAATTARQVAETSAVFSQTTGEISQRAAELGTAAGRMAEGTGTQTASVRETMATMDELQAAIHQIAAGAASQAQSAQNASETADRMAAAMGDVVQKAAAASTSAGRANETAGRGSRIVSRTTGKMEAIRSRTMGTAASVQRLRKMSEQVGDITSVITEIADQTNLLALNAAIEAARAGEHGKGFAVVAEEVRRLAERSSRSAGEIAQLISGIQQATEEASAAMELGTRDASEGADLAGEAGQALAEIGEAIAVTTASADAIRLAAEQIATASRNVLTSAENAAAISEENTAATEEMSAGADQVKHAVRSIEDVSAENAATARQISASAETMAAAMHEAAESARGLAVVAKELRFLTDQFKL